MRAVTKGLTQPQRGQKAFVGFWLPPATKRQLAEAAAARGETVSGFVAYAVRERLYTLRRKAWKFEKSRLEAACQTQGRRQPRGKRTGKKERGSAGAERA